MQYVAGPVHGRDAVTVLKKESQSDAASPVERDTERTRHGRQLVVCSQLPLPLPASANPALVPHQAHCLSNRLLHSHLSAGSEIV